MMKQNLPDTLSRVYFLLVFANYVTTIEAYESVKFQSLTTNFIQQLLQPFPLECHIILHGPFGGDILEILQSQRPLLLMETEKGLDLEKGMI